MQYNEKFKKLLNSFPINGKQSIDWDAIKITALGTVLDEMAKTMQNPEYHAEGDVFTHTAMVCERLIEQEEYINSPEEDKTVLFLAAILHDIGKIRCTRLEEGKWVSPYHSSVGALMARELLWKEFGLCGDPEKRELRESVCNLIRYHSFPPYAIDDRNAERKILKIAANGELSPGFSMRKLCLLERADGMGRISGDGVRDQLGKTECCQMLAEELGCLDAPFGFANPFSARAYFSGKSNWKEQEMFNDSWGEVILLSGMPGTGKDTWITKNCPHLPMISLDEIRKELKISPTDNQGAVIAEAHERARAYLRKKQSFVWNATNTTSMMRSKQITLFEQYNASVRTVFLETDWSTQLGRNRSRKAEVPEAVLHKLLSKLEIPERYECETVCWETV
ncbi:MAG: AAA family ATPase [Clostridia bacterium]|nr:AAA family ATPase [Clostridia bacterium]